MKNTETIIFSLLIGFMVSGLSYFIEIDKGDYIFRGFPVGFYNGVWRNGFEWYFSFQGLLFNFIVWSLFVFIVTKLIFKLRKKYFA